MDLAGRLGADWRLLVLAPTALVIQVAHPVIGAGVGEHSIYRRDPWGRAARSVWPVAAMVMMEDRGYGADLREMHRGIGGTDYQGRRYHAWDPEAAFLVLASAIYASEQARLHFSKPLSDEERLELLLGWRRAALSFGIPERDLPSDVAAYDAWFNRVVSERLEDHPTVHELLATLSNAPRPPFVPGLVWRPLARFAIGPVVRLVVTATLPEVLRERLGLAWSPGRARAFQALALVVRAVSAVLPKPLRNVNALIVRRYESQIRAHAAHGAELGIAPSIAPAVNGAAVGARR